MSKKEKSLEERVKKLEDDMCFLLTLAKDRLTRRIELQKELEPLLKQVEASQKELRKSIKEARIKELAKDP